jgi:hypothetical protein
MVALNTAYAAPKNAADPQNRVGDFFYEDHASVGKNRWAKRLNTQEKSSYHYETASGRSNWPNRDPIAERGGIHLYVQSLNDPINKIDFLGLSSKKECCGGQEYTPGGRSGKRCCNDSEFYYKGQQCCGGSKVTGKNTDKCCVSGTAKNKLKLVDRDYDGDMDLCRLRESNLSPQEQDEAYLTSVVIGIVHPPLGAAVGVGTYLSSKQGAAKCNKMVCPK